MEQLGRQRAIRVAYKLDVASVDQAVDIVARLRDQDVTSLLYAGDPLFPTGKARQQIWQPEWILAGTACTDIDIVGQLCDRINGPGPSGSATSGRSSRTCCANSTLLESPMPWVKHAIWWHVYPLGAVGADSTGTEREPTHRLRRLTAYLDHVVDLGASGVAMGPVFESSTHGYDTTDYFRIDPRLGDEADFDEFVRESHQRGLRVMLDGVFNHIGREHPSLSALTEGSRIFEGHPGLVTLNHADPGVADLVVEVMCHWLARGADAWRLDAAYAVPTAFWGSVLPRVRARFPDVYVVGEVLHGDYAGIVRQSGMDAVTQYELWKAVWSSLVDENFFELAWALKRHDALLQTFVPFTFLGNHDVTRLASRISDHRHRAHAVVLLMTLAGTPSIYYGDEVGMQGVKEDRAGGDDDVRPALPAAPEQMGGADVLRLHQELVGLRRRHPWLHETTAVVVHLTNTQLAYDVGTLRVLLNLDDTELWSDGAGHILAGQARSHGVGVGVPGHGWAVTARPNP